MVHGLAATGAATGVAIGQATHRPPWTENLVSGLLGGMPVGDHICGVASTGCFAEETVSEAMALLDVGLLIGFTKDPNRGLCEFSNRTGQYWSGSS